MSGGKIEMLPLQENIFEAVSGCLKKLIENIRVGDPFAAKVLFHIVSKNYRENSLALRCFQFNCLCFCLTCNISCPVACEELLLELTSG